MTLVVSLADAGRVDASLVGGKAASLGALARAGFPVPLAFVVTTPAFFAHLEAARATKLLSGDGPTALLVAAARNTPVDPVLAQEVWQAFRALEANGADSCAVRSSAVGEDGRSRSFAGAHATYYHVDARSLLARIVDCWLSSFTAHATAYRARSGEPAAMAVILQRMVPAEVSGVAFTRDPAAPASGDVVIDSCWGLGAALVDGRVSPDRYRVGRTELDTVERRIASKRYRVRETAGAQDAPRLESVMRSMRARPTLDAQRLERVARLALRCESHFGAPQDVEWAFADGEVHLLQSRPITGATIAREASLARAPAIDGQWLAFKPLLENFTGPLTPLTVDLVRRALPAMGCFVNGRWYVDFRVAKWLTPFALDDAALARLALLRAAPEVYPVSAVRIATSALSILAGYLTWGMLLVRTRHLPTDALERFRHRCVALLADERIDALATLRQLTTAPPPFTRAGEMPVPANLTAVRHFVYEAMLRWYTARFVPHLDEAAITTLCAPGADIMSMRLLADLDAVAETARAEPRLVRLLSAGGDRDALLRIESIPEGARFIAALERFLAVYGHRGTREIELAAPRWAEDPTPLLHQLRARLAPAPTPAPRANDPESSAWPATSSRVHRAIVHWLARRARRFAALRENTRHHHVLAFATVRRKLLALERQLLEAGRLKCPGDVFFLHWNELAALAQGSLAWLDVESRVRTRRVMHVAREERMPPLAFNIDLGQPPHPDTAQNARELTGQCACPGDVVGIARVVLDPTTADVRPGDILVAPYADPSWTPMFPLVRAVVVEVGSHLSHAGTVARELRLPCVVDVADCTRLIRTGQRLEVRAGEGRVIILDGEAE